MIIFSCDSCPTKITTPGLSSSTSEPFFPTDNMSSSTESTKSVFESAPYISPDLIFQVTKNYLADTSPLKINVGAGTYRDENGQPWVLPSVRMAKDLIRNCGHEYLPIAGLKAFRENVTQLIFHDTIAFREDRVSQLPIIEVVAISLTLVGLDCYVPVTLGDRCTVFSRNGIKKDQCIKWSCIHNGADLVKS